MPNVYFLPIYKISVSIFLFIFLFYVDTNSLSLICGANTFTYWTEQEEKYLFFRPPKLIAKTFITKDVNESINVYLICLLVSITHVLCLFSCVMSVWRSEKNVRCLLLLTTFFLKTGSLTEPGVAGFLARLADHQGPVILLSLLSTPSGRVTSSGRHVWLFMSAGDANSGSHSQQAL